MAEGKTEGSSLVDVCTMYTVHIQQVIEVSDMEKSFSFFIVNCDFVQLQMSRWNFFVNAGENCCLA